MELPPDPASQRRSPQRYGHRGEHSRLCHSPDDWTCPTGITFVNTDTSYTTNVYNAANWSTMESAGAVFLPAAGQRTSSTTTNVGTVGNYWSTSHVNGTTGYAFHIAPSANAVRNDISYSTGCSVRLVRIY